MSDIVFILGAGASADSGAPLMYNFLDTARDMLRAKKISTENVVHFERVFKAISALQAVHSKSQLDLNNIESIFAAFEMGRLINRLPNTDSEQQRELLITSTRKLIQVTLENSIKYDNHQEPRVGYKTLMPRGSYGHFANLLFEMRRMKIASYSIISFNYDLALDTALWARRFAIDYGLTRTSMPNGLQLLKLHGSLNWAKCKGCDEIIAWQLEKYYERFIPEYDDQQKAYYVRPATHLLESGLKHHDQPLESEPFIVPPTWNKTQYQSSLTNVWSNAARELSEAEVVIIIGYSLPDTDAFFRYLFALGTVGERIFRKFLVCDPNKLVFDKFVKLLGLGARDRAENILGDFRQTTEQLHTLMLDSEGKPGAWWMS